MRQDHTLQSVNGIIVVVMHHDGRTAILKLVVLKHDVQEFMLLQADQKHTAMVAFVCTYEECSSSVVGQADLLRSVHV